MRELKELARAYAAINPRLNKEIMGRIMAADDISELIYRIIAEFPFENGIKLALYDCDDIIERCNRIREAVNREIDIAKIRKQFMEEVHAGIDKHQKEYVLREQLGVIREELGENADSEADEYEKKLSELDAPDYVKEKTKKEFVNT